MAAIDRLTGSGLVVNWTKDGGSLQTVSGDQTNFSFNRKGDMVDVSAGSETKRTYKGTLEDLDFTLDIFDADQAFQDELLPLTTGLLEIYKKGTGSGKPLVSFNAIIGGYNVKEPFDGAIEISITGKRSGTMVHEVGYTVP